MHAYALISSIARTCASADSQSIFSKRLAPQPRAHQAQKLRVLGPQGHCAVYTPFRVSVARSSSLSTELCHQVREEATTRRCTVMRARVGDIPMGLQQSGWNCDLHCHLSLTILELSALAHSAWLPHFHHIYVSPGLRALEPAHPHWLKTPLSSSVSEGFEPKTSVCRSDVLTTTPRLT